MLFASIIPAAVVLAIILWGQHRRAHSVYRPLSSRQPQRDAAATQTPLGMEGLDLDLVDSTTRRNEALERSTRGWSARAGKRSFLTGARNEAPTGPNDETYAAWFHTAFLKDKAKEKSE